MRGLSWDLHGSSLVCHVCQFAQFASPRYWYDRRPRGDEEVELPKEEPWKASVVCTDVGKNGNYFTSCDPHHDIYTCSYWHIFWHSI